MIKIVTHCSASEFGTAVEVDRWHRQRGWSGIGYHAVIENGYPTNDHFTRGERWKLLNGQLSSGRPINADDTISASERGAHAYGFNKDTLAVCLIGDNNFTRQQVVTLVKLVRLWATNFKLSLTADTIGDIVVGHCELPGVTKTCPNIDMNIVRRLILNKSEAFSLMRSMSNVKEVW